MKLQLDASSSFRRVEQGRIGMDQDEHKKFLLLQGLDDVGVNVLLAGYRT
jgi:hypothetical protein